jgi:O-antigen ligase
LLAAGYVAIPYGDLPGLGLSLSAPLFFLIALELFLRPAERWWRRYRRWILWAAIIWLAIFLSSAINGLRRGGQDFGLDDLLMLFRSAYWLLLVFPVTVYLVSRLDLGARVVRAMAVGVLLTALLRWFEGLVWGKIGAGSRPVFFTQNIYGVLFSTFMPMLLALLVDPKTRRRGLVAAGIFLIWAAAAINGSRGSWVALAAGTLMFLVLYLRVNPRRLRGLFWVLALLIGFMVAITAAPERLRSAVSERYATLQRLEEDKTFLTRQVLIRKGLTLFQDSPLIGVGIGRWTKEYVALDLPLYFSGDLESFNRRSSHNSYLSFLAETGLLGAVPFGVLLFYLATRGLKSALRLARLGGYWALGLYVGFVTMSLHLWVLAGLTGTSTWMVYGLLGGMIERWDRLRRAGARGGARSPGVNAYHWCSKASRRFVPLSKNAWLARARSRRVIRRGEEIIA